MKKTSKKIICLTLAVLVFAGMFVGCSNETASKLDLSKNYDKYPIETTEELTYWMPLPGNVSSFATNMGETEYAKELEKRTGVKVKYIHPPVGNEAENLSLMIASGEMPDIIEAGFTSLLGGPSALIKDDVIYPLNDLIDKYAPNLKKYLEKNPSINIDIKTDDGEYYAFPFIRGDDKLLLATGPMVREDWLDELGLSTPQTIDEWENVLIAFRDKKNAEAPFSFNSNNMAHIYSIFNATRDIYIEDGKVKFGCLDPEFKEAVVRLNKWFNEGLLDRNYLSTDDSMITYNMLNGVTGMTIAGGGGDMGKWLSASKNNGTNIKLKGIAHPKTKDGDYSKHVLFANYYTKGNTAAITTSCKNPALAAKWLDYAYSEEGHILNNFGIENESFNYIDGYPTFTDEIKAPSNGLSMGQAMSNYCRSCHAGPFVQDVRYIEQYYATDTQRNALQEWMKAAETSKPHRTPSLILTSEEADSFSALWTEITKYRDEKIAGLITGAIPMEQYDDFIKGFEKLKVKEALSYQQKAYERFLQRK